MNTLNIKSVKKLSAYANAGLALFVAGMMFFYMYFDVKYMVYHSIGSLCFYAVFFYMIYKELLDIYVWLLYGVITVYMSAATICMGYQCGFHLYCMSMIPIIYYTEYMSTKLHTRKTGALWISLGIIALYLVCTGYVVFHGPVYEIPGNVAVIFLTCNSVSVFCFIISYTTVLTKMIKNSEDKLTEMAHRDRLTGLYNRHFMLTHLETLFREPKAGQWIAMLDIDHFKKINDTYGHNCGDMILVKLCELMQEVCKDCTIARWGGEEFLVTASSEDQAVSVMETLRKTVEAEKLEYQGQTVPVTITIGIADYFEGETLDMWIQRADACLYQGKNSGRNQVVKAAE